MVFKPTKLVIFWLNSGCIFRTSTNEVLFEKETYTSYAKMTNLLPGLGYNFTVTIKQSDNEGLALFVIVCLQFYNHSIAFKSKQNN